MKIGNWTITTNSIEWQGADPNTFVIETKNMTEEVESEEGTASLYKYIVLATAEEWLNEDDLYDLNFAFVYAAAKHNVNFDYQIFDETLSYQYSQLDEENEENEDDDDGDDVVVDDDVLVEDDAASDSDENTMPDPDDEELAALEQQRKEADSERD